MDVELKELQACTYSTNAHEPVFPFQISLLLLFVNNDRIGYMRQTHETRHWMSRRGSKRETQNKLLAALVQQIVHAMILAQVLTFQTPVRP